MESSDYSGSDEDLSTKTSKLENLVKSSSKKIEGKEKCFPTLLIVAVIAPIIIWFVFYFIKPSFVQKKNPDGSYQRDNKKTFMWTFIITLVVWACLYLWTYCKGYDKNAFLCSRK